jgi:hypothetical protein
MRTHKVLAAAAAVLALGLLVLTNGQAADDDKELAAALDKLVTTAGSKPDDLEKAGAETAKARKIDNENIKDAMDFLGKRDKDDPKAKGWGVGDKPGKITPDNIEFKVREMAKKAMSKDKLMSEKDALIQMANRTAALGSIALASGPKKKLPDKDPKDWKESSEDMIKYSKELTKAIQGGDPKVVKEAAMNLNASCSNCHGKFRD